MRKLILPCSLFLVALSGALAAKAEVCNGVANNLVSNCGFETGDFTGWTGTTTTDLFSGVDNGNTHAIGTTPYEGNFEAFLGSTGPSTTLSQTLATTAGGTYNIEFALLNDTTQLNPYTNSFSVMFDGATLFSETDVAADAYTLYSFSGTATSASTTLSFTSRNDQGDFDLDSVSAASTSSSVTPEPSSFLLLGTGLLGGMGVLRRRLMA